MASTIEPFRLGMKSRPEKRFDTAHFGAFWRVLVMGFVALTLAACANSKMSDMFNDAGVKGEQLTKQAASGRKVALLLPLSELLVTFHRHRVRRVLASDYGQLGTGAGRADGFVGAHGVSFLSVV